ncbi:TPA: AMP-binding protein, partial [Staphylococcus pseudintermedius]|nr:AMP-binding protein [Staphylococcus pseudintermedius]
FQQVFGMAEGLVNYTDLNDCVERIINTQGKPMSPYDEVKVVNENGEEIPNGEMGLLIVRGPYTIRGYYNSKKQNRKSFTKDGYYITGDLVSIDEEGYITVEGREKDTIVRGGENISAEEIENLILSHEKIIDVAVVGFDDQYLGEKICAFIVSNEIVTLSEIKIYLRNLGLASYKLPEKMIDFKRLPLTGVGKINKKKLREYLKKGEI